MKIVVQRWDRRCEKRTERRHARIGWGFERGPRWTTRRQNLLKISSPHPHQKKKKKKRTNSETPASASTRRTTPSRGTPPRRPLLRAAWTLRRAAAAEAAAASSQTSLRARRLRRPLQRRSPAALARRRRPSCSSSSSSSSSSRRRCPASLTTPILITMAAFFPLQPRRRPLVAWRRARWFRGEEERKKTGLFFSLFFRFFFSLRVENQKKNMRGGPRAATEQDRKMCSCSLLSTTLIFSSLFSTILPVLTSALSLFSPLVFSAV